MSLPLRLLPFAAFAAVLCVHVTAHADVKTADDDGVEVYTFDDDKLLSSNLGPDQAKIVARGGPVRTLLTHPRVTFVPELIATIENL